MLNDHSKVPLLTIGMPTKNSAWCIHRVLRAIEELEYPKRRIRLVFVDDYSTDGTFEILAEWKRKAWRYHGIILIQERTNIPQARNLCVKHAEGKYLLFWDSDVIPPRGLFKRMIDMAESRNGIGMIGADYSSERKTMSARMLGEPVTNKITHAVYMGFALIRRKVFERVAGFNELLDVGEDTEFGIKVAERTGYEILWAPKPVLHLRPVDRTERFGCGFSGWLSHNFHIRGEYYAKSFHKLPLLLRLRVFYYALLPPIAVSLLLLAFYVGVIWMMLAFIVYLLPGLFLAVSGSNIRRGTISFFMFNIPTGVALSYGVLVHAFKFLRK